MPKRYSRPICAPPSVPKASASRSPKLPWRERSREAMGHAERARVLRHAQRGRQSDEREVGLARVDRTIARRGRRLFGGRRRRRRWSRRWPCCLPGRGVRRHGQQQRRCNHDPHLSCVLHIPSVVGSAVFNPAANHGDLARRQVGRSVARHAQLDDVAPAFELVNQVTRLGIARERPGSRRASAGWRRQPAPRTDRPPGSSACRPEVDDSSRTRFDPPDRSIEGSQRGYS